MTATARSSAPRVVFDHLDRLTDERGVFEHALHDVARREHGYCVDDAARGVVVLCRELAPPPGVAGLLECYLRLVISAIEADGSCHNRMDIDGQWADRASTGDWWGRAVWAVGAAAVGGPSVELRTRSMTAFRRAVRARSPHRHAMAFAALGAAEVLRADPRDTAARKLLADAVVVIGPLDADPDWPWPESRLRYGNAALAEALIGAGDLLGEPHVLGQGLQMLSFLMDIEVRDGHLSVTPVGGRGRGDAALGFDQQPIEVAAIADACAAAYAVTADDEWLRGVRLAWSWFRGHNDGGVVMFDASTGAGFDGLERTGRNENRGAESTLALLSTVQRARQVSAQP
jgi:hypothetical protein